MHVEHLSSIHPSSISHFPLFHVSPTCLVLLLWSLQLTQILQHPVWSSFIFSSGQSGGSTGQALDSFKVTAWITKMVLCDYCVKTYFSIHNFAGNFTAARVFSLCFSWAQQRAIIHDTTSWDTSSAALST